jgi:hypothetical protein
MCRNVYLAGLAFAVVWTVGCGNSGRKELPAVAVMGTVTLDNKPMREGEISLEVVGEAAPVILPVKDGAFSGEVKIGKNRVEVFSYKQGPPLSTEPDGPPTRVNIIPDRYNGHTRFEANVTAEGPNEFKFPVTSR